MEQLSQSPFFPVPVRWFELPMQTARWGLAQLQESTTPADKAAGVATSANRSTAPQSDEQSAEAPETEDSDESSHLGVLLNERA